MYKRTRRTAWYKSGVIGRLYYRWWRRLSLPRLDERVCNRCRCAYHSGPSPTHVADFISGDVGVLVIHTETSRRKRLTVKVGRWRSFDDDLYLSQLFTPGELKDLAKAIKQACQYIKSVRDAERRSYSRRTG